MKHFEKSKETGSKIGKETINITELFPWSQKEDAGFQYLPFPSANTVKPSDNSSFKAHTHSASSLQIKHQLPTATNIHVSSSAKVHAVKVKHSSQADGPEGTHTEFSHFPLHYASDCCL